MTILGQHFLGIQISDGIDIVHKHSFLCLEASEVVLVNSLRTMQAAPCLTQFSRNLETLSILHFWQGRMHLRDRYQSLPARKTRPPSRPWRPPCPFFCDGRNCRRCAAGRLACCSQRSCFYTPPRGSPCCCRRQGAAQCASGFRKKKLHGLTVCCIKAESRPVVLPAHGRSVRRISIGAGEP